MQPVVPQPSSLAILAEFVDTGGLLDGAKIRLYQNDLTPTPSNVLGDFTVATFTGYANPADLAWGTPYMLLDGNATVSAASQLFQAGDPLTTPNVIYGWYMLDSAGTGLLASKRFDTPITVGTPLQGFSVEVAYPYNPAEAA